MVARSLLAAPWLATLHAAYASPSTVVIAPGVEMPLLNCGVTDNRSAWVQGGGRGLDTAFIYGDDDQRAVGEVVAKSGVPRSELFVTTKIPCCPSVGKGGRICDRHGNPSNSTANIQHDFDILGVDYVDLMLMHWPCGSVESTVETYRKMEALVRSGKARAIGVSDFNASMLDALVKAVEVKPVVNQLSLSVGGHSRTEQDWGSDDVTVAKCRELGITPSAWSPLGGLSSVDVLHEPHVLAVAAAHQRSAAQVALRWLVQQGIPIVTSTSSATHVAEDLAVLDFELSEQEMELLAAVPAPEATSGGADVVLVV